MMSFSHPYRHAALLSLALISQTALAIEAPSAQELLSNFGINTEQAAELDQGKIISYDVSETSNKELGAGVAMWLPVPFAQLVDFFKQGNLGNFHADVMTSGTLSASADASAFKKFAFSEKQADEAKAFIEAEAGDEFNLSAQELASLKPLQDSLDNTDSKKLLSAASQKYREFLAQRLQAYRQSGLNGIAAYQRDDGTANPAAELRTDAANSKAWAKYFPQLQQAWLNYPAALPENTTEQFAWMNRLVENRPTPILTHRLISATDQGGLIVSRQFYVGHSYNSSHVVAGGVPYKDGSLIFYSVRSSTDQVAGMGSGLKHSIGREQMKKAMVASLQRLNKALKRKAAPVAADN